MLPSPASLRSEGPFGKVEMAVRFPAKRPLELREMGSIGMNEFMAPGYAVIFDANRGNMHVNEYIRAWQSYAEGMRASWSTASSAATRPWATSSLKTSASAAGRRSWRGEERCRFKRWRPGVRTIESPRGINRNAGAGRPRVYPSSPPESSHDC